MKCKTIIHGLCAGFAFSVQMGGRNLSNISDGLVAGVTEPERENVG